MTEAQAGHAIDHLFRHEAGRLTAVLVRVLGPDQFELAEDIVQETLVHALEQWRFGPMPDNPAAWLTHVAKNRALDVLRHRAMRRRAEPDVAEAWRQRALEQHVEARFAHEVPDDMLRLMFSCCSPAISQTAQVAIILKALCGFSVREIASALLSTTDAVERRLSRAKASIRDSGLFEVQRAADLAQRLASVQHAIYLLFSEGYHGAHPEEVVRRDLCSEALRLGAILTAHPPTETPTTHALMALLHLLAARVSTRQDEVGDLLALRDQERSAWNPALIRMGFEHLEKSAEGDELSSFHLQAGIAAAHASAPRWEETDWARIVALYDVLLTLDGGPIVRLNRAIAIAQRDGASAGLAELDAIDDATLPSYPFLFAARAEVLAELGERDKARDALDQAITFARNPAERRFLQQRSRQLAPL